MGGAWKRFGPIHCTGDARSAKTGSVIQKSPRSLINIVEWPRRNRLRSGAASSAARVKGSTGSGAFGTVVFGLLSNTFQMIPSVLARPSAGLGAGLRKRPSAAWGEAGGEARGRAKRLGACVFMNRSARSTRHSVVSNSEK